MTHARRQFLLNAFKLFDLGLMVSSFVLAALVVLYHTQGMQPAEFFAMRVKIQNFVVFALFLLLWHWIFSAFELYASRRLSVKRQEVYDVIKATTLGTVVIFAAAKILHISLATLPSLVIFWLLVTGTTVVSRILLRFVLAYIRRHGRNLRDVLIVGTNERALEFAAKAQRRPDLGYRIIGFVDQDWQGARKLEGTDFKLVSDLAGMAAFLRANVVDEVFMALPMRSFHDEASRLAALCEEQGIPVRLMSNILNLKLAKASAEEVGGDAHITHSTGWKEGWPVVVKRTFDLLASSMLLLLLSPVLVIAAICIKLTSPGPVMFVQRRLGLSKRRFLIYKFRTMVVDAEKRMCEIEHLNEITGPVFKIKNDPRITAVGRFLRKTSIDELPQLFNVLRGDMSLVGPRPLPVRDYEGFNEDWQRRRFSVKPGITCLWQVRGRNSIPFEEWMELDLQYIDKWSLWLDFRILLQTIPAVLRGSGAA
jgi:exopolysaccharide biosynthesis polyprenyl glycosylphosphotransferase